MISIPYSAIKFSRKERERAEVITKSVNNGSDGIRRFSNFDQFLQLERTREGDEKEKQDGIRR